MKQCLQCKTEFKPLKPKAIFCSAKCRVYWHRANPKTKVQDLTTPTNVTKPPEPKKTNYTINTAPPPIDKENDPKEGTSAFKWKYGVYFYSDIPNQSKK